MARVVVELPRVNGALEVGLNRGVPAEIQRGRVLKGDRFHPKSCTINRRGENQRYVLEEHIMNAWRTNVAVQSVRVAWCDQRNGLAGVHHRGNVQACAVVRCPNGQGQGASHGGFFHRRVAPTVFPSPQARARGEPDMGGSNDSVVDGTGAHVG